MQIDLDGKVALVTGASRGIGKAVAGAFAGRGASVMLSSRKIEALEAAAGEIGGDTAVHAANAGEPDQIAACVAATVERFGRIDVLVNNAATNPYMGRSIDIDLPRFDKTWQVNYRGPVVWCQEVWRESMREHGGSIVNIASVGGLSVETHIGHYNVTKAALIHPHPDAGRRPGAGRPGQRHRVPAWSRPTWPAPCGSRPRRPSPPACPCGAWASRSTSPTRPCSS